MPAVGPGPLEQPPYDPDADTTGDRLPREWDVLAAVAAGGVAGSEARYGLAEAIPHAPSAWPWATLVTNALGSLAIGVLLVVVLEVARNPHRLLRPLLGVGVLGGFTTFSTFAVEVDRLAHAGRLVVAAGYVAASLVACLVAVAVGAQLTRRLAGVDAR